MNFNAHLFLGFPIDDVLARKLNNVSPAVLNSFISEDSNYLKDIEIDGIRYLGKFVETYTKLRDLELLEANIYSLLAKIEPNHLFYLTPLVLLINHE